MQEAGEALAESLAAASIGTPDITVISASDGKPYADGDDIRARMSRQVYSPVRWTDTMEALVSAGAGRILECGPGKVLAGLTRRIDRSIDGAAMVFR